MSKRNFTFMELKKEGFTVSKEIIDMAKDQRNIWTKISSALKSGPKTIPEISDQTGLELHVVTWYLMTYLRYRLVKPCEKDEEGFWRYELTKGG